MKNINKISFHDSTINYMEYNNDYIDIKISDAKYYNDNKEYYISGYLHIKNNIKVYEDHIEVFKFVKKYDEGEIIHLDFKNNKVEMIVEWVNYIDKSTKTNYYQIEGENIYWEATSRG